MARLVATITVRLESDQDEQELGERIEKVTWDALVPLVNADVVSEVSHVDVDVEPES